MSTHAARRSPGRPPVKGPEHTSRLAEAARLAAWTAGLLVIAKVLHGMDGTTRVPLGSATQLVNWLTVATPIDMAAGGLRLAAIIATWYLLATTAITVVADRAGWQGIARAMRQISPAVVQRVALRGGGVGLAIGSLLGAAEPTDSAPITVAAASAAPSPEATAARVGSEATMARLNDAIRPFADAELAAAGRASSGTATMTAVDDIVASPAVEVAGQATMIRLPTTVTHDEDPASENDGALNTNGHARSGDEESPIWTVQPGDSLWSIATEVLSESSGNVPPDAEIVPYWQTLIAANGDRLAVPDNPDLLIPGQQLLVPAPNSG